VVEEGFMSDLILCWKHDRKLPGHSLEEKICIGAGKKFSPRACIAAFRMPSYPLLGRLLIPSSLQTTLRLTIPESLKTLQISPFFLGDDSIKFHKNFGIQYVCLFKLCLILDQLSIEIF
jgi:hypothetical protein